MQKAKRILNIVFSVLFILATSLPLVFSDRQGGAFSEVENRTLASFPTLLAADGSLNKTLVSDTESWINDNVGGRDQMTVVNTALDYHVFGQSARKDTLLGKEGWAYYYTADILRDYQNKLQPAKATLALYQEGLPAVQKYLDAKGIPFLSFLVPDKKTVYPEYYPDSILKLDLPSRSELVAEALQAAGVSFQPLLPALLEAKQAETVYSPRVDTAHWNNYGAFVGYQAIVKAMQAHVDVDMLTLEAYDVSCVEASTMFNDAIPFTELDYQFKKKTPETAVMDTAFYDPFEGLTFSRQADIYKHHYVNEQAAGQPSILYIGDSYFKRMEPFFRETARELTLLSCEDLIHAQQVIDAMNPDIVIFEIVERGLGLLRNQSRIIRDEGLYMPPNSGTENGHHGMWIDYAAGQLVQAQGTLSLPKGTEAYQLEGWACDFIGSGPLQSISVQVGESTFPCDYGIPRESVATFFDNRLLLNTGFTLSIPGEALWGMTEIAFLQTLSDGTQKEPVIYTIAWA